MIRMAHISRLSVAEQTAEHLRERRHPKNKEDTHARKAGEKLTGRLLRALALLTGPTAQAHEILFNDSS